MIDNLNAEQLEAILDTLPMNFIFVDENERLIYRNKAGTGTASGAPDVMGEDIRGCHKQSSLPRLDQMVSDFKNSVKDEDEFWMMVPDRKILNRFLAVRDKSGRYLGMIEYLLDFTAIDELAEAKKNSYKRWPNEQADS